MQEMAGYGRIGFCRKQVPFELLGGEIPLTI